MIIDGPRRDPRVVFVSSRQAEFQDLRAALADARDDDVKYWIYERYQASGTLKATIRQAIVRSDLFLLLSGDSYTGQDLVDGKVSWPEFEYRIADRRSRLLRSPDIKICFTTDAPSDPRQAQFLKSTRDRPGTRIPPTAAAMELIQATLRRWDQLLQIQNAQVSGLRRGLLAGALPVWVASFVAGWIGLVPREPAMATCILTATTLPISFFFLKRSRW